MFLADSAAAINCSLPSLIKLIGGGDRCRAFSTNNSVLSSLSLSLYAVIHLYWYQGCTLLLSIWSGQVDWGVTAKKTYISGCLQRDNLLFVFFFFTNMFLSVNEVWCRTITFFLLSASSCEFTYNVNLGFHYLYLIICISSYCISSSLPLTLVYLLSGLHFQEAAEIPYEF